MKIHLLLLTAAAVACFASCKKDNSTATNTDQSAVMYVNAMSAGSGVITPVFGYNNGVVLAGAENMATSSHSAYIDVKSNSSISFWTNSSSGGYQQLGTSDVVGANLHYSYFAYGTMSEPRTKKVEDVLLLPSAGSAKVRIANLLTVSSKLTAYWNGTKIDENVDTSTVDGFVEIPAGIGTLKVVDTANASLTVELDNQNFATGKLYTIIMSSPTVAGVHSLTVINNF
jgi:hypothetical protein